MGSICAGPRYVELTAEEAYMVRKQQELKLHTLKCSTIEETFRDLLPYSHIAEEEFIERL